jgi:hypothetical protein
MDFAHDELATRRKLRSGPPLSRITYRSLDVIAAGSINLLFSNL